MSRQSQTLVLASSKFGDWKALFSQYKTTIQHVKLLSLKLLKTEDKTEDKIKMYRIKLLAWMLKMPNSLSTGLKHDSWLKKNLLVAEIQDQNHRIVCKLFEMSGLADSVESVRSSNLGDGMVEAESGRCW